MLGQWFRVVQGLGLYNPQSFLSNHSKLCSNIHHPSDIKRKQQIMNYDFSPKNFGNFDDKPPQVKPSGEQVLKVAGLGLSALFWIGVVIVCLVVFVSCAVGAGSDDSDDNTLDRYNAQVTCEKATKQQLKAPDTAKFHWDDGTSVSDTEYDMTGRVSSDNSFGAFISTDVTCTATLDPDTQVVNATANLDE